MTNGCNADIVFGPKHNKVGASFSLNCARPFAAAQWLPFQANVKELPLSSNIAIHASSILWVLLAGGAAVLIVIRTIKYNKARDREYEAYKKALQMLKAEVSVNLDLIARMQHHMTNGQILNEAFETSAWRAVLADGLVGHMHKDDAKRLTDVYRAVEEVETYLSQLIEITGQPSLLEGLAQRRGQYQTSLTSTLEELTPQLQRLMRAG